MSEAAAAAPAKTTAKANTSQKGLAVQRKCACGQRTIAGGECETCRKKRLKLQRWDRNRINSARLSTNATVANGTMAPGFGFNLTHVPSRTPQPLIHRPPRREEDVMRETPEPTRETALVSTEATPAPEPTALETAPEVPTIDSAASASMVRPGLLVEDEATDLRAGQMRKSEFITELRTAVRAVADAELAAVGRDTAGCPYLAHWFNYYEQRDAAHGERALRRYAPDAQNVTHAREYIPIVAERVGQGVARWAKTGEISGVPAGIPLMLPGGLSGGIGSLLTGAGRLLFKARAGGAQAADDPEVVRAQLGNGRSLDSGVRSRMESAFGTSFSQVRLHNDSNAANLSSSQNARAFTVGEHVAFAAGEYQPGTILGDALIAHELAHVVQQSGAPKTVANMDVGNAGYDALEKDADETAVNVMTSIWGKTQGSIHQMAQNAVPQVRSGLRLQRCATTPARRETLPEPLPIDQPASEACSTDERQSMERFNPCCTTSMLREIGVLKAQAIPIVQGAVNTLATSPDSVAGNLWEHFHIRPTDSGRLPQVVQQFRNMLTAMRGHEVIYGCRDKNEDPMCRPNSIFPVRASTSPTCTEGGPYYMHFCADYTEAARASGTYFSGGNWLRTFIHEYAHVGCSAATPIYPASSEFYHSSGSGYSVTNPDRMIQNADCYAWFAMSVRDRAAASSPESTGARETE